MPASQYRLHQGFAGPTCILGICQLKAGSLDVVIAAAPLHTSGIKQLELFEKPFVLAIPVGHELAQRPVIYAADLRGEDMVLLKDGHCLSGHALNVCPAKQRSNNNRLHAMSLETLRHMVTCGAGYTLLPCLAVGEDPPVKPDPLGESQRRGTKRTQDSFGVATFFQPKSRHRMFCRGHS